MVVGTHERLLRKIGVMIKYDISPILHEYDDTLATCQDEELKNVLTMCKLVHDYFEEHFYDNYSAEKAHYHLHLAQEAISQYKLDIEEGLI